MTGSTSPATTPPVQALELGRLDQIALATLGLVLLAFGFFYLLDPALSLSSIDTLAVHLGLGTNPPNEPAGYDRSWLIFTFAYMMGATACCFLALLRPAASPVYLELLLLLKVTSSLTGLAFYLALDPYGFYLATFLTDGVIALIVFAIYRHVMRAHLARTRDTSPV